ncbi:MAG: hypothetical protein ACE5D8_04110 [Fidelibacterota bacterium]
MNSPHHGGIPNGYLSGNYPSTREYAPVSVFDMEHVVAANNAFAPWMLYASDDHGDDDHNDDYEDDDTGLPIITKNVSVDSTGTGSVVTYTITITNNYGNSDDDDDHGDDHGDNDHDDDHSDSGPNGSSADSVITEIIDILPGLFNYIPGSTGGITAVEPGVQNNTLTWTGPWTVSPGQSVTLTFDVHVGLSRGYYENSATAVYASGSSITTGPTAGVQVIGPQLVLSKTVDTYNAVPGDTLTYTVYYSNAGDDNATFVFILESIPAHTQFVPGSAQGSPINILFSPDGGISYGSNQTNVTDISFQRLTPLLPGESGFVIFRVIIQ